VAHRTKTHRWLWLPVLALTLPAAALADDDDLETLEELQALEEVLHEEMLFEVEELEPAYDDNAFWEANPEFDVTVHYSEELQEYFWEGEDGDDEFEMFEGEMFDPGPSIEDAIRIAQMLEDFYAMAAAQQLAWLMSDTLDSDGDGWSNRHEFMVSGTDPFDPDTDDDGWVDGPANARYSLQLISMSRHDTYDWWDLADCYGDDDIYFIVDDARWPQAGATYGNAAINGEWTLKNNRTITPNTWIEERVMPTNGPGAMTSRISIWDDDADLGIPDDWYEDDKYAAFEVDLLKATPGVPFHAYPSTSCSDFTVTMAVWVDHFADPDPFDGGYYDSDSDGISDGDEANLARWFRGMGHPNVKDIWVEFDRASDIGNWAERSRYMVVSQFERHGISLHIDDGRWGGGTSVSHTGTLSESDYNSHYANDFTDWRKGLFRYALLVDDLWTGKSGKFMGDGIIVDTSRFWFPGAVTDAGTFMHELGHALGLRKHLFPNSYIDSYSADPDSHYYYSCMNYWYQYRLVDYSEGDDPGKDDINDWALLDLAYELPSRWSVSVITP